MLEPKYLLIYGDYADGDFVFDLVEEIAEKLDRENTDYTQIPEIYISTWNLKKRPYMSGYSTVCKMDDHTANEFIKVVTDLGHKVRWNTGHAHPNCRVNEIEFEGYGYHVKEDQYMVFYESCEDPILDKKIVKYLENTTENNKYLKVESSNWNELCHAFEKWILEIIKE